MKAIGYRQSLPVTDATENPKTVLVIGAAGGVGSIMVQLLRRLTGVTIIGTATNSIAGTVD